MDSINFKLFYLQVHKALKKLKFKVISPPGHQHIVPGSYYATY